MIKFDLELEYKPNNTLKEMDHITENDDGTVFVTFWNSDKTQCIVFHLKNRDILFSKKFAREYLDEQEYMWLVCECTYLKNTIRADDTAKNLVEYMVKLSAYEYYQKFAINYFGLSNEKEEYLSPLKFDFILYGINTPFIKIITVGNIKKTKQYYSGLFITHGYKAELMINKSESFDFYHQLDFKQINKINLDCYLQNSYIWSKSDIVDGFRRYFSPRGLHLDAAEYLEKYLPETFRPTKR